MGNFPVRSKYILSVAFVTALMNMVVPVWGSGSGCGSIGGTVGCCVDWRIWRSWSRCPLTVWIDLPRCLVTSFFCLNLGLTRGTPLQWHHKKLKGRGTLAMCRGVGPDLPSLCPQE